MVTIAITRLLLIIIKHCFFRTMKLLSYVRAFQLNWFVLNVSQGSLYQLTAGALYVPSLLVGEWMCYDDLKSQYGQFCRKRLSAPPHNIHIVFWEVITDPTNYPAIHHTGSDQSTIPQVTATDPPEQSIALSTSTARNNSANEAWKAKTLISMKSQNSLPQPTSSSTSKSHMTNSSSRLNDKTLAQPVSLCRSKPKSQVKSSSSLICGKAAAPSPRKPLASLSKSLTSGKYCKPMTSAQGDSPSTVNATSAAKIVPLLSSKLSRKRKLADGLSYGSAKPTIALVDSGGTCQDMACTPYVASQYLVNPHVGTSSSISHTQRPAPVSANKSYLDLVKPLLQKNKQKNKLMSGYVPKSQRTAEESVDNNRKKVMFEGVIASSTASKPCRRTPEAIAAVDFSSKSHGNDSKNKPVAIRSRAYKPKGRRGSTNCSVSNVVPSSSAKMGAAKVGSAKVGITEMADMPSFDDMFTELC